MSSQFGPRSYLYKRATPRWLAAGPRGVSNIQHSINCLDRGVSPSLKEDLEITQNSTNHYLVGGALSTSSSLLG